jgi:hypothetical protein
MATGRFFRGFAGLAPAVAGCLLLGGCMGSMNDLSRDPQFQPPVAVAIPVAPAASVVGAAPAPATPPATAGGSGERKLLTPEEQARVIAELEALAAKQGAPLEAARAAEAEACSEAAAQALDPEERLKRERQGLKC